MRDLILAWRRVPELRAGATRLGWLFALGAGCTSFHPIQAAENANAQIIAEVVGQAYRPVSRPDGAMTVTMSARVTLPAAEEALQALDQMTIELVEAPTREGIRQLLERDFFRSWQRIVPNGEGTPQDMRGTVQREFRASGRVRIESSAPLEPADLDVTDWRVERPIALLRYVDTEVAVADGRFEGTTHIQPLEPEGSERFSTILVETRSQQLRPGRALERLVCLPDSVRFFLVMDTFDPASLPADVKAGSRVGSEGFESLAPAQEKVDGVILRGEWRATSSRVVLPNGADEDAIVHRGVLLDTESGHPFSRVPVGVLLYRGDASRPIAAWTAMPDGSLATLKLWGRSSQGTLESVVEFRATSMDRRAVVGSFERVLELRTTTSEPALFSPDLASFRMVERRDGVRHTIHDGGVAVLDVPDTISLAARGTADVGRIGVGVVPLLVLCVVLLGGVFLVWRVRNGARS